MDRSRYKHDNKTIQTNSENSSYSLQENRPHKNLRKKSSIESLVSNRSFWRSL